jgi:hypothetical protein
MLKSEMRIHNFFSPSAQRYRVILVALLLVLCVPLFFYNLMPNFTRTTDEFILDLAMRIRGQDYCTKEIGGARCCRLFLDATPCVDECRKHHVNRVTFVLTREYEICADECLGRYDEACGKVR